MHNMAWKKAILLTAFVLFGHMIAIEIGVYRVAPWFDAVSHFGGGFAMGFVALALYGSWVERVALKKRSDVPFGPLLFKLVWILGFVALVGIAWEWFEYVLDGLSDGFVWNEFFEARMYGYHQPSLTDTMADFFFDLSGGLVALLAFDYEKRV